jgi:hypothetical protein
MFLETVMADAVLMIDSRDLIFIAGTFVCIRESITTYPAPLTGDQRGSLALVLDPALAVPARG